MVLTKPIGIVVGQVVTNAGGTEPVGVGGIPITVTGVIGYSGLTATFGSAKVTTDANGCFAVGQREFFE